MKRSIKVTNIRNNNDSKNIVFKEKPDKSDLIKKFKEKSNTGNSKAAPVKTMTLSSSKNLKDEQLKKIKNDLKSMTRKNTLIRTEMANLKKTNKLIAKKLLDNKKLVEDIKEINSKLIDEKKELHEKIKISTNTNKQNEEKILELEANTSASLTKKLTIQNRDLVNRNTMLVNSNREVREINKILLDNIVNIETRNLSNDEINNKEYLEKLKKMYENKIKEVESLYKKNEDFINNFGINDIAKWIEINLSHANIEEFEVIEKIATKIRQMRKYKYLKINHWRSPKVSNLPEKYLRYGYIVASEDMLEFYDIQAEKAFPISSNESELIVDCPAKALDFGEFVRVIHVYNEYENIERPKKIKEDLSVEDKEKDESIFEPDYYEVGIMSEKFADLKVLIVGSRFQSKYTKVLLESNINLEWHNPFEESGDQLINKYNRADIILICTMHISHSVLDVVDVYSPKVELIKKDNTNTIQVRIRHNAINRGLVSLVD